MKKRIVEYRGRKYRVVKGVCPECPLRPICCLVEWPEGFSALDCGDMDFALRETLRSRLANWWRGWVKRHIIDDYPYDGYM